MNVYKLHLFDLQLGNPDLFNSYLQSLKRSVPGRGLQVFWDLLVQGAITLVVPL